MDRHYRLQVSTNDTEVIVRFQKNEFPIEVAHIDAVEKELAHATEMGDKEASDRAVLELHEALLLLLRAPIRQHEEFTGKHLE